MSETSSQSQHNELFKKMMDEQISRTSAMFDEVAKLESKGVEQTRHAIEEATKLTEESIKYVTQLSADWRKMSLDAFRKTAELWSVKA
jgi:hypothetical protein